MSYPMQPPAPGQYGPPQPQFQQPQYAPQPPAPQYAQPVAPVPGPPPLQPMAQPLQLATFTAPPRIDYDRVKAVDLVGRPLLLKVEKLIADYVSKEYPNPKDVITVDLVDLTTGQIHIGPMWGAGRVVDHLKSHAGTGNVLPIKLVSKPGNGGREYLSPEPLDGPELAYANQWFATYPTALADSRTAKEAQSAAANQSAPLPPMPVQGLAPAAPQQVPGMPQGYAPAPAQQPHYDPAQGYQQPAPQYSGAPQQYAPVPPPAQPQQAAPQYAAPAAPQGYQQPAPPAPAGPANPAAWQPTPEQHAAYMAQQAPAAQGAPMNPTYPAQQQPQYPTQPPAPPMQAPAPAGGPVMDAEAIQRAIAQFQPQG